MLLLFLCIFYLLLRPSVTPQGEGGLFSRLYYVGESWWCLDVSHRADVLSLRHFLSSIGFPVQLIHVNDTSVAWSLVATAVGSAMARSPIGLQLLGRARSPPLVLEG